MPKSRTCHQVEALLELLVDGDLSDPRTTAVWAHLHACQPCMAEYHLAALLPGQLLTLQAPEPPATLVPAVMGTVRAKVAHPTWTPRVWAPLIVEAVLAAVIAWRFSGFSGIGAALS